AGMQVPCDYVSATQLNAIVPYAVNPNAPQYLLVQRGLTYSVPALINVAVAQPSLFSVITGYPANGGGPFLVTPSAPAQAGDTVVLYCTGLGPVTPRVSDGAPASGDTQTENPVELRIGGARRIDEIVFLRDEDDIKLLD